LKWQKSVLARLEELGMEAVDFGLTWQKPNDKKPERNKKKKKKK
jgi:hypothetical protein